VTVRSAALALLFVLAACSTATLPVDSDDTATEPPAASPQESPFVTERVLEVVIEMEASAWQAILADPLAEEYHPAAVVYDGERLDNVAVRVKGNSSLHSVAGNPNSVRYSFKLDTNRYVGGQKLRGVKKLNFNNGFKDPSLIREHLGYRLAREMGLPAPRTAFADLTVAGVHLGLYTVVEHVDDDFVESRFPVGDGDLYKPDFPDGRLNYRGDSFSDYSGIELKTNEDSSDHSAFLRLVDVLAHGSDSELGEVLNVEEALRYIALNTLLVNLDSYTGNGHNYYLYEEEGTFQLIPWDLNEAFGNFNCGCDRDSLITLMMDEPTCSPLQARPVVARLLNLEEHRASYHQLLQSELGGLFTGEHFSSWIDEAAELVRATVEADQTKFFSTADFEQSLVSDVANSIGLQPFVVERSSALADQLAGLAPSSGSGEGSCSGGGPGGSGPGGGGPGGGPGGGGQPLCPDDLCDNFEQNNCGACPQDCQQDPVWLANCS